MSGILGLYTKVSKDELEVVSAISRKSDLLIPNFGNMELKLVGDRVKHKTPYVNNSSLNFFQNGILIPYDLVMKPDDDLKDPNINLSKKKYYPAEYIATPDFFYAIENKDTVSLIPIDIKNFKSKKNKSIANQIKQTSMFNTAMLYWHSDYMKLIVHYLNNTFQKQVEFDNGFFIFINKKDVDVKPLNKYLEDILFPISTREGKSTIRYENNIPELIYGANGPFDLSDMDFTTEFVSGGNLINHLGFIKNRLVTDNTIYPNMICSISGFNSAIEPILRFEYNPATHIMSFRPQIETLKDEILKVSRMSKKELLSQYLNLQFVVDKRELRRLEDEIFAKKIRLDYMEDTFQMHKDNAKNSTNSKIDFVNYSTFMNQLRIDIFAREDKIKDLNLSIEKTLDQLSLDELKSQETELKSLEKSFKQLLEKRDETIAQRCDLQFRTNGDSKKSQYRTLRFSKRLNKLDSDIESQRKTIDRLRVSISQTRERNYIKKVKKGPKEWYEKEIMLLPEQVEMKNRLLDNLRTKLSEHRLKQEDWEQKDIGNMERILLFNSNNSNKVFTLSENPVFPTPRELFLQSSTRDEVLKVSMFSSVHLK